MKAKRITAWLLTMLMIVGLMPASAFGAANHNTDLLGRAVVSAVEGKQVKGNPVIKVEFQAKTLNGAILGLVTEMTMKYDEDILEVLNKAGTESAQSLITETPRSVAGIASGTEMATVGNAGGFAAMTKDGITYVDLCPEFQGTTAADSKDWVTMGSFYLMVKSGPLSSGIPGSALTYLTAAECKMTGYGAGMRLSNQRGDGYFYEDPNKGTMTMEKPSLETVGFEFVKDALKGSVTLTSSAETAVAGTVLTAAATGTSTAEGLIYTWKRGGEPIAQASGTTYTATAADAGKAITVEVSHADYSGVLVSNAISVYGVPGAPENLTVRQSSSGELTYSWSAPANTGGKPITGYTLTVTGTNAPNPISLGADKTTAVVANLTVGSTYKAQIVAVNEIGPGASAAFADTQAVNKVSAAPPVFTKNLSAAAENKEYGDTLALEVAATIADNGTLTYQWYEADGADSEGTAISGAAGAAYSPVLNQAHTRYFYCVATNTNLLPDIAEELRGDTVVHTKSVVQQVNTAAKKPAITELTLTPGNSKLEAKWSAQANGADIELYTILLTHQEAAQSGKVTIYEYEDGSGSAKTVRVTADAVNPTFSSGGALYITDGGISCAITKQSSETVEITPAGISTDVSTTTSAVSYSFTGLKNGTAYTLTLTAKNAVGDSEPAVKEAAPKASSGGGGGGGGSSSSGSTAAGTDIKKDIPSSGSVTVSTSELKNAKSIEAKSSQITVTLNQQAINKLDKTTGLIIKTEKKNGLTVNDTAKGLLGSRPVFDVTATQNGKAVTDFGSGRITISIAYTPSSGEDAGKLFLYSVNEKGEAEKVSGSRYDATLKAVTGQTNHLSLYAVGYDKDAAGSGTPVTGNKLFRDVSSSDWFYTAVMNLAGKEILSGVPDEDANGNPTGTYQFHPQNNVTRAEFATMLAKAAGANLSQYSTKTFNDVSANDWYAGAVGWASSVGVASGTGSGSFSPNANITRQDMAVMVSKYVANVSKTALNAKNEKVTFTDGAQIADYAKSAVETMQTAGIISGTPNEDAKGNPIGTYQFRPFANATRAEAAAMLNGLLGVLQ